MRTLPPDRSLATGFRRIGLPAAVAALVVSLAAAPASAASWTVTTNPTLTPFDNVLFGVDARTGSDGWAVGYADTGTLPTRRPLIQRWNGSAWRIVQAPTLGSAGQLHDVDAPAATDAWAVGYVGTDNGDQPLTLRWDGERWTNVPSPGFTTLQYLRGVRAFAAADAWAVGHANVPGTLTFRTYIQHWDGTAWTAVKSPSPEQTDGFLNAVDGAGPGDVWAVGNTRQGEDGVDLPLIMRWQGAGWRVVPTPPVRTATLHDVTAVAANDVWAVGSTFSLEQFRTVPYALHWNGVTWQQVAVPAPASDGGRFYGVGALGPNRVYAAGEAWAPGRVSTLVMRWNGTAWTREAAPSPAGAARLYAASAAGPGRVWTAGDVAGEVTRRPLTVGTTNG